MRSEGRTVQFSLQSAEECNLISVILCSSELRAPLAPALDPILVEFSWGVFCHSDCPASYLVAGCSSAPEIPRIFRCDCTSGSRLVSQPLS